jgi:hypothetical protein
MAMAPAFPSLISRTTLAADFFQNGISLYFNRRISTESQPAVWKLVDLRLMWGSYSKGRSNRSGGDAVIDLLVVEDDANTRKAALRRA